MTWVFVPADALGSYGVTEAALVARELAVAGLDLDEDDLVDVLLVHALEDQEVYRLADEACLRGFQVF